MADGEFIGPGGIVRQTILATAGDHHHQGHPAAALLNGSGGNPGATSAQWNPNIKTEPVVATVATSSQSNYFPATTYEWKVETDPQQLIQKKSKNRTRYIVLFLQFIRIICNILISRVFVFRLYLLVPQPHKEFCKPINNNSNISRLHLAPSLFQLQISKAFHKPS